ncbi:Uu.00g093450.m01.CDS01 [Anthostomella pinea]|uniref:Uu.00g093450.m01.CDS01 n=1 Tax=Anthostomella pinea TaxID=933095 RepID=A0AAI8YI62_9PEZI|nr:Uu.00g093450.m01.CDS01 [Anthostomella pinea]
MADYAALKVPDLKKLLQEKSLQVTGNKADLIARLQEHDKAQEQPKPANVSAEDDPIDYSDDDEAPATSAKAGEPAKPAEEPAAAPAEVKVAAPAEPEPAKEDTTDAPAEATDVAAKVDGEATEAKAAPEEAPKTDFSAHLPASIADEEARKRAERAKRFGVVEENNEDKKKAERATRFGVDESATVVKGLDSALPEKRERKRGREGASGNADGERGAKRHQNGGNDGGRRGRGRQGGNGRQGGGGRDGGRDGGGRGPRKEGGRPNPGKSVMSDPAEKARAEARAKRFGGGA